jgi:hypothetical protein
MSRNIRSLVVGIGAGAMALVCCFAACTASVRPGGGGGGPAIDFTIGGKTFTIDFGGQAVFDVVADGPAVEKAFSVRLFEQTPTDEPTEAEFIVEQADVQILPRENTTVKWSAADAPLAEGDTARVRAFVAGPFATDPCTEGSLAMEFELRQVNGQTMMYVGGQEVDVQALFHLGSPHVGLIRQGVFTLCLEVSSDNVTSRIQINGLGVKFYPAQEPANANENQNANDNADGNANDNGGGNANDNTADNTNDNAGPPVDPRDPDGDGNFTASACDALDAVVLIPGEPELIDSSCAADAYFQNISSRDIAVYMLIVWDNWESDDEGWWSQGAPAGETADDVVHSYAASNISGGQRIVKYIAEIAATWADEDYFNGCAWISSAIREDDTQESLADLRRRFTEGARPCE